MSFRGRFASTFVGGLWPGLLSWIALVVLVLVGLVAVQIRGQAPGRETRATQHILEEKGATVIRVLEAASRTTMRPHMANMRMQYLFEEISRQPDVIFVALLTPSGYVLEYSGENMAGRSFLSPESMRRLDVRMNEGSAGLALDKELVLAVYRFFTPMQRLAPPAGHGDHDLPGPGLVVGGMMGAMMEGMMGRMAGPDAGVFRFGQNGPPALPPLAQVGPEALLHPGLPDNLSMPPGQAPPVIMVGFDAKPLKAGLAADQRYTRLLSGLVFAWGLIGALCLFWFQHARASKRRLQEEVRRREQLVTAGDLAAGVAHELRNPLSSIKGYATYFASRFPDSSPDKEAAQVLVQETERLNRAITNLINFARPSAIAPRPTDLNALVIHNLNLIRRDAESRRVDIAWNPGNLPLLLLDPDRFSQALLNVLLNALEAMPDGGTLTLATSLGSGGASLTVADTGVGLAPESVARVFDPYFTTKSQGTGLGLSIVSKIVEAHNASVGIRPGQNGGAVVSFTALRRAGKDERPDPSPARRP